MYQKIKLDKFSLMLKNTINVQKVIKEMNLAFCAVIFFVVLSLKKVLSICHIIIGIYLVLQDLFYKKMSFSSLLLRSLR